LPPKKASDFEVEASESVGLNADKLDEINTRVQSAVDPCRVVGCLALIARGETVTRPLFFN
jgi:hypothetical protein